MNNEQFPPFLAYGQLDEASIRSENNYRVADYKLLGERVMKVKLAPGKAELIETLHGKGLAQTRHQSLKAGFMHHFTCINLSESRVMAFLVQQVSSLGNIFFHFIGDDTLRKKIIYYPAAYLFVLRVPVTENNAAAMNKAMEEKFLYDHFSDLYRTSLIIDWKNGQRQEKDIILLELISPIAYLYETVKWLTDRDLILKEKFFRALVQNATDKNPAAPNGFLGSENDRWSQYSILYKTLNPGIK